MSIGNSFQPPLWGAIVGFALAQVVNLIKLIWNWWRRPKLVISTTDSVLLWHETPYDGRGEYVREEVYGFKVSNRGRRVAVGTRFEILQIETRDKNGSFEIINDSAIDLAVFAGTSHRGAERVTLIPGSTVAVELGKWDEAHDAVWPSGTFASDYYEEICSRAVEYRFTVCAFEEGNEYKSAKVTIRPNETRLAKHAD